MYEVLAEVNACTTRDDAIAFHQLCWDLASPCAGPSDISRVVLDGLELALATLTGEIDEYNELINGSSR